MEKLFGFCRFQPGRVIRRALVPSCHLGICEGRIPILRPDTASLLWYWLAIGLGGIYLQPPRQGKIKVASLFHFLRDGVHVVYRGLPGMRFDRVVLVAGIMSLVCALPLHVQAQSSEKKVVWKSVEFAIVKFNDEAPKSWSMYHTEKKGVLLLRLWKRYLLVNVKDEEVYEIDPQTVKPAGDNVEWSLADKPSEPLKTPEWKTRDIGPMQQVSFRLGKGGSVLQLQIPLKINGQPMY
jgi:hypothetical protein